MLCVGPESRQFRRSQQFRSQSTGCSLPAYVMLMWFLVRPLQHRRGVSMIMHISNHFSQKRHKDAWRRLRQVPSIHSLLLVPPPREEKARSTGG